MPKPQRARRVHPPDGAETIRRAFGDSWLIFAGQARIWSFVLTEIPLQVYEHERLRRESITARIRELEAYFPNDPAIERLAAKLDPKLRVNCSITAPETSNAWACTIASVFRSAGEWPHQHDVKVEFALCREGEMKIRCSNTPPEEAKLPPYVRGPESSKDARERAESVVRAAIRLVRLPEPDLE